MKKACQGVENGGLFFPGQTTTTLSSPQPRFSAALGEPLHSGNPRIIHAQGSLTMAASFGWKSMTLPPFKTANFESLPA